MVLGAESEPAEDRLRLRLQLEPARRLETVLQIARAARQALLPLTGGGGHLVVQPLDLLLHREDLRERLQERLEHGPLDKTRPLLRQVAERGAPHDVDGPAVRLFPPRDQTQERRLPGAVRTDQPDPRARRHRPVDALEDLVDAVVPPHSLQANHALSLHRGA